MERRRVALYLRVSTQDQSCELQRRDLLVFAEARGWEVHAVFEDAGKTGTNTNRPQFKAMLKDAQARKFDIVACWKLDRMARSLKDLVTMLQEFADLGIAFVSLKDSLDLSTSSGRLMMHVIGAFSEFEASLIKERVRAGVANARSKGKRLGRPRCRDDAQIIHLRAQGYSIRRIARVTGTSTASVQRALSVTKSSA